MIASTRRPERLPIAVKAVAALGLGLSMTIARPGGPPAVRAADDGLGTRSTAVYTVQPDQHRVHVDVQVRATNQKSDTQSVRYYFVSAGFFLQPEATHLRATAEARTLDTTVRARTGYSVLEVRFGRNLYHGQAIAMRISYDLPGGAPRSRADIRVESAFVSFTAWSFGDAGDVRVEMPAGFASSVIGGPMDVNGLQEAGQSLTASDVTDPASWYAVVTGDRPDALSSEPITLGGGERFVVRGWPEDTVWRTRVADRLERGLPILERLVGLRWPVRGDLEVTERAAAVLEGYAGFYLTDENRIEISEELDDLTIVHETSHAWFNQRLFGERWINEGLADTYATLTLGELGLAWQPIPTPNRTSSAAFPLVSWPPPGRIVDTTTEARELYGYNASHAVIDGLVREVGPAKMRDVFSAADGRAIAYVGAPPAESIGGAVDWRRFLDYVQERGGSTGAEALIRKWVVDAAGAKELDARDAARAAYARLVEHGQAHGQPWLPPMSVRSPMAHWTFQLATTRIGEAEGVLVTRDSIATEAANVGVTVPASLRSAYQTAIADLGPVQAQADRELGVLRAIGDAGREAGAARDVWVQLGLLGGVEPMTRVEAARADFQADDMTAAQAAVDDAGRLLDGAGVVGRERVAGAVRVALFVALVLAVLVAWIVRRRRRVARRAAVAALTQAAVPDAAAPYGTLAANLPTEGRPPPAAPAAGQADGWPGASAPMDPLTGAEHGDED